MADQAEQLRTVTAPWARPAAAWPRVVLLLVLVIQATWTTVLVWLLVAAVR